MNVGQKVNAMKADLAKIVSICNINEDWRLANQAQSCLQQIGQLSTAMGTGDKESDVSKKELTKVS